MGLDETGLTFGRLPCARDRPGTRVNPGLPVPADICGGREFDFLAVWNTDPRITSAVRVTIPTGPVYPAGARVLPHLNNRVHLSPFAPGHTGGPLARAAPGICRKVLVNIRGARLKQPWSFPYA